MKNIIIADDHKMFLDGLCSILEKESEINVIHTFRRGDELLKFISVNPDIKIDLVISDISMPGADGLEVNKTIKKKYPGTKTLILSMHNDAERIRQACDDNADGYVLKNAEKEELLRAIHDILQGNKHLSPEALEVLSETRASKNHLSEVKLSQREKDVVRLIAQEYTTQEIADELILSKHTIESYRKNLMLKLQVKNLAGLTRYAIKMKLISI